jgi:hypothetical protein
LHENLLDEQGLAPNGQPRGSRYAVSAEQLLVPRNAQRVKPVVHTESLIIPAICRLKLLVTRQPVEAKLVQVLSGTYPAQIDMSKAASIRVANCYFPSDPCRDYA